MLCAIAADPNAHRSPPSKTGNARRIEGARKEPSPPKADRVSFRTEPSASCTCGTPRDALLEGTEHSERRDGLQSESSVFFSSFDPPPPQHLVPPPQSHPNIRHFPHRAPTSSIPASRALPRASHPPNPDISRRLPRPKPRHSPSPSPQRSLVPESLVPERWAFALLDEPELGGKIAGVVGVCGLVRPFSAACVGLPGARRSCEENAPGGACEGKMPSPPGAGSPFGGLSGGRHPADAPKGRA